MNINTQQLRYFMELAKCLNFTRAAANLYVAQPTLSQQIADLEAQLGVTLFNRSSRSVSLTPAGAILQRAYPDLMAQLEQIQQRMLVTAAGFSGNLTVGFCEAFMDTMPLIMRDFKNTFPDVVIKPVYTTLNELNHGLKNHTIDVSLSMIQDFAPEEQAAYTAKTILQDPLCFVLPAGHPVTPDYAFAEAEPLIVFSEAVTSCYYPHIISCLQKLGIRPPQVIFTESPSSVRAYLESGAGYSVLPAVLASFFSESTQFIPLPDEYLQFGALWEPTSANPTLPLFLDALEQFLDPTAEAEDFPAMTLT